MIMMMGKYVRGRVWCINCPRFHASYQFQVPCQGFLSTSSVRTGYQWQHTISWRPEINDSPKTMIHLLATIKRYCNYLWMSELLYWLLQNVECRRKMALLINMCWYSEVHFLYLQPLSTLQAVTVSRFCINFHFMIFWHVLFCISSFVLSSQLISKTNWKPTAWRLCQTCICHFSPLCIFKFIFKLLAV